MDRFWVNNYLSRRFRRFRRRLERPSAQLQMVDMRNKLLFTYTLHNPISCWHYSMSYCAFILANNLVRRIVDAEKTTAKTEHWYARDPLWFPALRRPTARANFSQRGPSATVTTRGDLRCAKLERVCFGRSHCRHTAVRGVFAKAAVSAAPTTWNGKKKQEGGTCLHVQMTRTAVIDFTLFIRGISPIQMSKIWWNIYSNKSMEIALLS